MAGNARFTALLDACVLFPAPVADALMSMHVAGLYTARWTRRIEVEWIAKPSCANAQTSAASSSSGAMPCAMQCRGGRLKPLASSL